MREGKQPRGYLMAGQVSFPEFPRLELAFRPLGLVGDVEPRVAGR